MQTIEIANGTRKVIASRNDSESKWSARLYVNDGETATTVTAKFKTEDGVRDWAAKQLNPVATFGWDGEHYVVVYRGDSLVARSPDFYLKLDAERWLFANYPEAEVSR